MLVRVIRRIRWAKKVDQVVVATTPEPADDAIAACCATHDCPCFRGSRDDLLDRYYQAARRYRAGAVVRITSDCPLIDPGLIDRVVQEFLDRQPAVTRLQFDADQTIRGLDTEVVTSCPGAGVAGRSKPGLATRHLHLPPSRAVQLHRSLVR